MCLGCHVDVGALNLLCISYVTTLKTSTRIYYSFRTLVSVQNLKKGPEQCGANVNVILRTTLTVNECNGAGKQDNNYHNISCIVSPC